MLLAEKKRRVRDSQLFKYKIDMTVIYDYVCQDIKQGLTFPCFSLQQFHFYMNSIGRMTSLKFLSQILHCLCISQVNL